MQEATAFKNPTGQNNKNNAHTASEEQDPSMFSINYIVAGEMLMNSHTLCGVCVCVGSVISSITILRYFSFPGHFPYSCFHKSSRQHDPGGRNGVCAGHLTLRAAGAVHCGWT